MTQEQVLKATGLSVRALRNWEKAGYVKPVNLTGEAKRYTRKDTQIAQAMVRYLGRCANLQEAYKIAIQGISAKNRRNEKIAGSNKGVSDHLTTRDPDKIKLHPRFERLLEIDEDLEESLTVEMAVAGYYPPQPIVLGSWPGLKAPC